MVHANAVLAPSGRLLLARRIVVDGWPVAWAAEYFQVSWRTADRWQARYRAMGEAGMADRSSRPHHSPNRTPAPVVRKVVDLRWRKRLSPQAIASRLSMPASTVHAVPARCRSIRLSHFDIRTGEVIRRYENPHAGSLIHVDAKKLGNAFVHRVIGDHSRVAYAETHDDETADTAIAVLRRAVRRPWCHRRASGLGCGAEAARPRR